LFIFKVNNDTNSTPIVHLIKVVKNDKAELKLKSTWRLNQIKSIKLLNEDQSNRFEILIDSDKSNKFEWKCENRDDCTQFLTALWKLSEKFLSENERPKFINFQRPENAGKFLSRSGLE
jgi:hypothetical protein